MLHAGLQVHLGGLDLDITITANDGEIVALRADAERPIGFVFQDCLLFPRLTALDNIAFGLRARGVPKSEARAEAHRLRIGRALLLVTKDPVDAFGFADRLVIIDAGRVTKTGTCSGRRTRTLPRQQVWGSVNAVDLTAYEA